MSCGEVAKTCLLVGEIDLSYLPFIQGVIDTHGWRVFHLGTTEKGLYDHPNYRYLKGDIENELLLRTLFVQYDFCAVGEVDVITALVEDIARKQWDGDFENRRYLRMGKGVINSEVVDGFLVDTSFDSSVLNSNLLRVIDLLDTQKSLPESIPFF